MTRRAEAALLVAAVALSAGGTALVTVGAGEGVTVDVVATPVAFGVAFGGFHLAIRHWAARAVGYLLPLVAILAAVGWIEVFRIDRDLGRLQRGWLIGGASVSYTHLTLPTN